MREFFEKVVINGYQKKQNFCPVLKTYLPIVILLMFVVHPVVADWTSFRGNPQLTGVAEEQLPEKLDLLWAFEAGDMIESTAAVVDDTAYIGALDGMLYAIDTQTGKSAWKYEATDSIKSSPSVKDGVIYFGDSGGIFHAVDIAKRKKKWQYTTEGEIISSANIVGNRVLFGSYDGFLYCLNTTNGELAWKYETEGYVHGTPAVYEEFVIVTGCDSYMRVINITDGTQRQQVNLGAYVGASPAILIKKSGAENRSIAYCGTYGNEVLGVDLTAGEIVWRYQNPVRQLPFFASAAATDNIVLIGGRDKMMHALTPEKGEPIWTYTAKTRIESSAVIVGKRVFFGTTRGVFLALDIATGDSVWEFDTASSIVSSPSVAAGKIYIGTEDGILYCFGEQ